MTAYLGDDPRHGGEAFQDCFGELCVGAVMLQEHHLQTNNLLNFYRTTEIFRKFKHHLKTNIFIKLL